MNNRRNILIILSSLLFLTLSGLVAWYVFFYRCKNLPEQFSKFEKYVTNNDCSSTVREASEINEYSNSTKRYSIFGTCRIDIELRKEIQI